MRLSEAIRAVTAADKHREAVAVSTLSAPDEVSALLSVISNAPSKAEARSYLAAIGYGPKRIARIESAEHILEANIARTIREDADSASLEELEAASHILSRTEHEN